jgi:mRNA interferase MazF
VIKRPSFLRRSKPCRKRRSGSSQWNSFAVPCRSTLVLWTTRKLPQQPIISWLLWTLKKMIPARGEVWLFDLGMAEKVRPALVVSVAYGDADRALVTIIPHTTSLRDSRFEIAVEVGFLKPGAFLVQNVATYPIVRAIRKLGRLKADQFELVFTGLLRWLGHD